jgi:hypothetical protein
MFAVKIIQSFFRDRVSFVAVGKEVSARSDIPAGVPQGSPLSPLILSMTFQSHVIAKLAFTQTTPHSFLQSKTTTFT